MKKIIFLLVFFPFLTFSQSSTIGLKIGDIAPELSYKNPNNKEMSLSSLRGKLVLIDFWASWC